MIILTMNISILPHNREEVLKTFRSLKGPTLVEPGCKKFIFYEEIEKKDSFGLIQEWETQADFERYVRMDHFKKILALMEISKCRPEFEIRVAQHVEGIETIEAIRLKDKDREKASR